MGLAPYGEPLLKGDYVRRLVKLNVAGGFELDLLIFATTGSVSNSSGLTVLPRQQICSRLH
jgi:hypothetical protein